MQSSSKRLTSPDATISAASCLAIRRKNSRGIIILRLIPLPSRLFPLPCPPRVPRPVPGVKGKLQITITAPQSTKSINSIHTTSNLNTYRPSPKTQLITNFRSLQFNPQIAATSVTLCTSLAHTFSLSIGKRCFSFPGPIKGCVIGCPFTWHQLPTVPTTKSCAKPKTQSYHET